MSSRAEQARKTAPAFAFGGADKQAELLRAEGVEVSVDGFVDLDRFLWDGL